ncbi:imidazolonepropionase-like amidohydrolase [Anaerospora hongkongensis]|uniref:Imidazolonepropionase-like amidohydrolase n=1 Tax=Anaerospora hongkongensis TaxID=244830 RepID=A0A4R1PL08_9FIRM|nr:amidohydrolase [Anaerospora hongkongensis]TCL31799.1 imidazolonepropionase-like amidohydrolase [Anaerospora hongkongensis]
MLAITGGVVHTVSNGTLEGAVILIDQKKIIAVGQHIAIPSHATVISAAGKEITPGLIDCHTHLGIAEEGVGQAHIDKNEVNSPLCPHLRAIDAINPEDQGISDALCGGVTTIIVTPGSENVIGGQSVAIKTYGNVIDHMVLRQPAGMKIAFGENPIQIYMAKDRPPSTRMTIAGMIREQLVAAQNYARNMASGNGERDLRMEALVQVLNREIPLRAHAHAADDIMTAIRIADEFNLLLTLEHATAGHKIAEEIAKRSIPAVIGPSITARVKVELKDRTYRTPALLHEAGVKIALITDHPFLPINCLRLEAALAIKAGLPRAEALRAITLHAAQIIGVSNRVGSIEVEKDADLVIFDGDPFAISTHVANVIVDGQIIEKIPGLSPG